MGRSGRKRSNIVEIPLQLGSRYGRDMDSQEKQGGNPSSSNSSADSGYPEAEDNRPSYHNGVPQPTSRVLARTVSEVRDGIVSRRDLELGASPVQEEPITMADIPIDHTLVTWSGPDDPTNPKNWPFSRKWVAVFIVSTFTLIAPVSSSMVAPSLTIIGEELDIPEAFMRNLVLSIFLLAYAIGPLIFGPLSEVYGRVLVLQLANLLYLAFNLGCGFARSKAQLILFRFVSGLGGSAPLAIGGGVLADLFAAEQRGRAMSLYSLTPLLGPAIGPIAGAFITEYATWRWTFWATSALDAAILLSGLLFLRETHGPVVLARRRRRLVRASGNPSLRTPYDADLSAAAALRRALTRPFRMLATQAIVQCLALYMMYLFGLMYIVLTSFPALWSAPPPAGYGESIGVGGLNYISLGLGFWLGAQVCAPLQDRVYAALKARYAGPGRPEYRTPMMVPGAVLVPAGLLVYGWTAEFKTHWIGPNVGALVLGAGCIIGFQCLQGFLVDSYQRYAASAVAAVTLLRSLAGFGFPLFAPSMYERLGYGWGNTLMAFLGVVIGWPGPILLWKYGEALRKRTPFAAGN
ncbi:major facilitator superfamily transporter [Xylariaceae sp. FL0662B]|nr:major facilitator superfamily transporter [Xylariaceae sp. FL0662B]